ncbi:MAG TPA: SHOCT domain-containing protein [Patescibacteria group bacterium]|nr:SHOCT domain-containing protein [Patescibacteria group bacterium]
MKNSVPIYENNYMGFWIKVYPTRVEFKSGPGMETVAINQIASVQLGMFMYMQIIIETTGGRKYKIPCGDKEGVRNAIYAAQDAFNDKKDNGGNTMSVADEITKLNELKEKGIITQKEFDTKKKKLLDS